MSATTNKQKTEDVRDWWDKNPFTLGVATNDYKGHDLVGRIPEEKMDLRYFQEIDRKFRKHSGEGAQEEGKPLLSKLIDFKNFHGKKVLDIAIGSGLHSATFAEQGGDVTGIDLTPFAVMQSSKNLELRHLKGNMVQMDAQHMTFPSGSFNFVNAWGCLMHMPDTQKAISEIHRVLQDEGRVLAYMYNKSSWPFWFNIFFLRGVLLGGLVRYRGNITRLTSRYSDGAHTGGNQLTKFFTPKEASGMFKNAGFREVEAYPWDIGYEPDGWPMGKFPVFKYLPVSVKAWMAKRWGYGLIIKAKK